MADEIKTTQIKDGQLEVTTTKQDVQIVTFNYDDLIRDRQAIQDKKDRDNAQRDIELAEVDALIQAAKDGGIDKPIDGGGIVTPT